MLEYEYGLKPGEWYVTFQLSKFIVVEVTVSGKKKSGDATRYYEDRNGNLIPSWDLIFNNSSDYFLG